ncbi:MAG: DUF6125 family protein [Candidatus Binatia bacterium]
MNHQDNRPLKVSSPAERESLLIRCWMTHDAMWFFHCAQECGMEKTNKINKAAVRSMAQVEIKRIKKALGIDKVETFQQLTELMEAVFDLMKADFMGFTWNVSAENTLRWDMPRCFAYDGVQKLGVADQYQCGIFERMEGWAEGLGLKYSVTPQVQGCMMHTEGRCFREFRFEFGEA